ncbi:MAG: GNAT family N-acetyltransferase [Haliea sp.]|nr:MAG: GNAT family N-acetyltransferase [Haliea sp.]
MGILIRPATPEDANAACALVRRSIAECCAEDHGHDPARIDSWLKNKTLPQFLAWMDHPAAFSVVAERQGAIVGFAMAQAAEVQLCYLVPEARFTGTGKAMLAALENHAVHAGVTAFHLQSTRTALAFYARNGFAPAGAAVSAFGLESLPMRKALAVMSMNAPTP